MEQMVVSMEQTAASGFSDHAKRQFPHKSILRDVKAFSFLMVIPPHPCHLQQQAFISKIRPVQ